MRPLRIIYVFGHHLRIGGHCKSGLAMVKKLEAMGHHVIVLAPGGVDEMVRVLTATGAEFLAVPELDSWHQLFPPLSGMRRIIRVGKERSVDIIHAQDFRSVGRAYAAAILSGKAFVFTEPGGAFTHHLPPMRTDTVVFSREQMTNLLKAHRVVEENLHLIRARIDRSIYRPGAVEPSFAQKHVLPESGKKIAMAMRLELIKMPWLKTILETAETLRSNKNGVCIVIAGEGALLPQLREEATRINGMSKSPPVLHFVGPIFGIEEINQFYNYADVVVGSGRGILEAMACRKPVVVLGENGEGEVVTPANIENVARFNFSGRHFRYHSESPDPLSVVLENLLGDPTGLKQLGDYSYEYVKVHMAARIGAEQLVEVYNEALKKRSSPIDYAVWYMLVVGKGIGRVGPALKRRVFSK